MSALTAIKSLNSTGLEPAITGEQPQLRWIPVSSMRVNRKYQRELSHRSVTNIRKIVNDFAWARIKALSVVDLGDGTFEVIDGQHTATAAATHGGIESLPALVMPTAGAKEKAAAFVGINTDRLNLTPMQIFWAEVEAGDPVACAARDGAEMADAKILRCPPSSGRFKVGDVIAVQGIKRIAKCKGKAGARRVMQIGVSGKLAPIPSLFFGAMETLLWAKEYRNEITDEEIVNVLRMCKFETLKRQASAAREAQGGSLKHQLAIAIWRLAK